MPPCACLFLNQICPLSGASLTPPCLSLFAGWACESGGPPVHVPVRAQAPCVRQGAAWPETYVRWGAAKWLPQAPTSDGLPALQRWIRVLHPRRSKVGGKYLAIRPPLTCFLPFKGSRAAEEIMNHGGALAERASAIWVYIGGTLLCPVSFIKRVIWRERRRRMQRTDYNAVEFVRQMLWKHERQVRSYIQCCFLYYFIFLFFLLLMHHNSNLHILKVNTEGITRHVDMMRTVSSSQRKRNSGNEATFLRNGFSWKLPCRLDKLALALALCRLSFLVSWPSFRGSEGWIRMEVETSSLRLGQWTVCEAGDFTHTYIR